MYITFNNKKIQLIEANTFLKKLCGFMFKTEFNYALRFRTNSIHTFFMKKNIDVILTNKNNKVLYIYKNLTKNKIIFPKKHVYYTYEFPNNTVSDIKINDILIIKNN